jgi:phage terminase large subunit GpA-like protein
VRVLTKQQLSDGLATIAAYGYCPDIAGLARRQLHHLTPPENISTLESAERYRHFPSPEGGGTIRYSRDRTPYNIGPMNALDNPACNILVMVKPSRSGGTTVPENYLFKMMKFGPMANVGWYLNSAEAAKKYAELVVKPMFDLHADLAGKIGTGRSDNNDLTKRVSGYMVEWMAAADNNFRNREPMLMVLDESDGYSARFAATPVVNIKARQKQLGNRRKGIVMSHPDRGWASGSAAAWIDTSRGVYVMRCPHCSGHAAAHATKYWRGVPEFRLSYRRDTEAPRDERLAMAERTASLSCPHCGADIGDDERKAMIDEAATGPGNGWMHRGQSLDVESGIVGQMDPTGDWGFWCHGTMLKTVTLTELARDLEAAIIVWETTRKSTTLREFMAKQLCEIFEGKAGTGSLSGATLQGSSRGDNRFKAGTCPAEVKFITAAVDVGSGKFDVSFRGWDLEGRSWWLDRNTIRQCADANGIPRDIRTRERIEDWDILYSQVIDRTFPIVGSDDLVMPVAAVAIDVGDGNVTWKGREFARRAVRQGRYWGTRVNPWSRVRLIQGSASAKAPELPIKPNEVNKDEQGHPVAPTIKEYILGVHKLKELAVDRLAVDDGGPGQCFFGDGIAANYFDEFFNERLVDGKWERSGANESLDLFAYEEAVRLMLRPDRKTCDWDGARPIWGRPVSLNQKGGEPAAVGESLPQSAEQTPAPLNVLERFAALSSPATGD